MTMKHSPSPRRTPLVLVVAALLSGCGTSAKWLTTSADVREDATRLVRKTIIDSESNNDLLTDRAERPIQTRTVPLSPDFGDVSVKVDHTPFGPLITSLARSHGYSVMFAEGVNQNAPISADIKDLAAEAVMRKLAMFAGYVAVVDRTAGSITIADTASYTFRLPLHVMQALSATYKVGGNPISSAPSGSSGGSASGSSGSGSGSSSASASASGNMQADFTVSGTYTTNSKVLAIFIGSLAGRNADIQVMPELGMITVRSNAIALNRVHEFLTKFANDALKRVQIQASIIDVSITGDFEYGIDWSKVLSGATTGNIALTGAATVTNPALTANVTRASISTVIKALQTYTNLRVISQPTVMALNHTPAQVFDGQQLPYVPSIQVTTTPGASGSTTQASGSGAFAVDGVTLSIQPDILSDRDVQLTIVPVVSNVQRFQTFAIGTNGELTLPVQASKQSLMTVATETGQTVILGGIRYSSSQKGKTGIPGLSDIPVLGNVLASHHSDNESHREVVILLRATILPSQPWVTLFSESM